MTEIPPLLQKMTFHDVLVAFIHLKPGSSLFVEEALAHGVKKVFEGDKHFEWLSHGHNSPDSCGATHTSLDSSIDGLHLTHAIRYTESWQYSRLSAHARQYTLPRLRQEYGENIFQQLTPLAREVWKQAQEYQSMYNRKELY